MCYTFIGFIENHCNATLNFVEIVQSLIFSGKRMNHVCDSSYFIECIYTIKRFGNTWKCNCNDIMFFYAGLEKCCSSFIDIIKKFSIRYLVSKINNGNIVWIFFIVFKQILVKRTFW